MLLDFSDKPSLKEVKRQYIEFVLRECDYNLTATAKWLKVSRANLYRHFKKLNIIHKDFSHLPDALPRGR